MASPTTNFGWSRPTVGGDNDIWGNYLNSNLTSQDSLVRRMINNFIFATAPAEAQAGTVWVDNSVSPWSIKIYDGAAWIETGTINPTTHTYSPSGLGINFYVGDMKFSMQNANHGSWILCNGQTLNTGTYSALFALIGYTFGGTGSNFFVPDMRGRVPGTVGAGSGLSVRTLGQTVGTETVALVEAELASHKHFLANSSTSVITAFLDPTNQLQADADAGSGVDTDYRLAGNTDPAGATVGNSGATGSGAAHNNMQPTLFVGNYFIYSGV